MALLTSIVQGRACTLVLGMHVRALLQQRHGHLYITIITSIFTRVVDGGL